MKNKAYDHLEGEIMAYEDGSLNYEDTIDLFQHLINTGLCWQLQGSYGRMAQAMLDQGLCVPKQSLK
jgi:hypothetical protein